MTLLYPYEDQISYSLTRPQFVASYNIDKPLCAATNCLYNQILLALGIEPVDLIEVHKSHEFLIDTQGDGSHFPYQPSDFLIVTELAYDL